MRSKTIYLAIVVSTFSVLTFRPMPVYALPNVSDLINACEKNIQADFQTQHLAYRLTSIISRPAQGAVTNTQTIEMYKKKPDLLRMITDNGYTQEDMIAQGDYMYLLDHNTGKRTAMKAAFPINPFLQVANTLSKFDSASVTQNGNFYEVSLRGGEMPDFIDHEMIRIDSTTNTMIYVEGVDTKGNKVLTMDVTYQTIGKILQIKSIVSHVITDAMTVDTTMNVLANEINQNIDPSIFAVK